MPSAKRLRYLSVRVSDEIKIKVARAARAMRLSESEYVRDVVERDMKSRITDRE